MYLYFIQKIFNISVAYNIFQDHIKILWQTALIFYYVIHDHLILTVQVGWFMVFNATFNTISVISIMVVSFIGGGSRSTWIKPNSCRKSLTNYFTCCIEHTLP